jgi:hypothetical protein
VKSTLLIATALVLIATACDASAGEQSSIPNATDAIKTTPATDPPDSDPAFSDPPSASDPSTSPDSESSTTVSTQPPAAVQPLYEPGDIDRGLQPFIDQAIDDLAARLDVDASSITARAAVLVVWPDASLGCPQPDMQYAQVTTDGSVIELDHDRNVYRYHTGGTLGPFICERPITKAPATELRTLKDFDD